MGNFFRDGSKSFGSRGFRGEFEGGEAPPLGEIDDVVVRNNCLRDARTKVLAKFTEQAYLPRGVAEHDGNKSADTRLSAPKSLVEAMNGADDLGAAVEAKEMEWNRDDHLGRGHENVDCGHTQ